MNQRKRGNKPKGRNKNGKKWATLGEYSGKWDYYVQYDVTKETTPLGEIIATGWDDYTDNEERDNMVTGTVAIKDEDGTTEDEFETEIKALEILATSEMRGGSQLDTNSFQGKFKDSYVYPSASEINEESEENKNEDSEKETDTDQETVDEIDRQVHSELKDVPYEQKWSGKKQNFFDHMNRIEYNYPPNLGEASVQGKKPKNQFGRLRKLTKKRAKMKGKSSETALHTTVEDDEELDYPRVREFQNFINERSTYPSTSRVNDEGSSVYNPPPDSVMGPPVYPPARDRPQGVYTPSHQLPYKKGQFRGGYGDYYDSQWTLPPAMTTTGAMLVLPSDVGLWAEVIARWESITINKLNELAWPDNKAKLIFVENLLGENEKKMWQQWRTAFPDAYSALENMAEDPQNITSQIRNIILMEDPYRGSTEEQDRAYRSLERITCQDTKDLWSFLNDYWKLATKSGRMFFPSTTEKYFTKLPQSISKRIEDAFRSKYPGLNAGVLPAIKFTHSFIQDMCTEAALQKELRDLSLCSSIPIPGYYNKSKGRYGIRKSRTYKGKPHDKSHVKVFKRKYKNDRGRVTKCKCYICGKEGHFARDCKSKTGNMARRAVIDNLDLKEDWDVVSADFSDKDTIYSISEGEGGATLRNIGTMIEESPLEETAFVLTIDEEDESCYMFHLNSEEVNKRIQEAASWKPEVTLSEPAKSCGHEWQENEATGYPYCRYCGIMTTESSRLHCPKCKLTSCALCAHHYLQKKVPVKRITPEPDFTKSSENPWIQLVIQKDNEWKQMIKDQAKEYYENQKKEAEYLKRIKEAEKLQQGKEDLQKNLNDALKTVETLKAQLQLQEKGKQGLEEQLKRQWEEERLALITSLKTQVQTLQKENARLKAEQPVIPKGDYSKLFPPLERQVNAMIEVESHTICKTEAQSEAPRVRKLINNQLYNVEVEFDIPGIRLFTVRAIIDTGATSCCIHEGVVPQEAKEEVGKTVYFNGLNSRQPANHKIKAGNFRIHGNKFRIPLIYVLRMQTADGIDMLIGTNFTRGMKGGLRIEGNEVTFYKKITTIKTEPTTELTHYAIEELEMDEPMYHEIQEQEWVYFAKEITIKERFKPILERLKKQGYIGEDPLKHWSQNEEVCKLEIINPDITIQDKPLKHVTPTLEDSFKRHTDALIKLGVIRPSKSRHRTMAMIVNSGTTVDPVTGRETKGKERMVFNYRTLNDNTFKDQYSLPGINTLLKRIGNAKVFSKFDLKSGFHQIAMAEESIEWTAFLVPGGLYEWLVMPFGLKNAPAVFQRKMDRCFRGTEEFIAVYIDDILVFSNNEKDHIRHLEQMLKICQEKGLVLSPTKMKIAATEIEFLGATIGNSRIKLQAHIIKKICDFNEEKLKSKAGLRSFLGILNYARAYIPKLSTLLGPLYEKTNPHGDKRLKSSDYDLIKKIKEKVKNLPDLEIPPEEAYIIIETDGCMDGWGGVCKWKMKKQDPRKEERVCAYASGKFQNVQSTIDAEISACTNSLEKLKIYYLDKREITLRTDCQAIISFYNKTNSNKASRVRWLKFADLITGTGVLINIEHIDGKNNVLADSLSRLVNVCFAGFAGCTEKMQEVLAKGMKITEELLTDNKLLKTKKNGSDQIMLISEEFQKYLRNHNSQNQQHSTGTSSYKHTNQAQDPWQKETYLPTQQCKSNYRQPIEQSELCGNYKPSWTSKPKYACLAVEEKITGTIIGPTSSNRIVTCEKSLLNLRPYATNWAETSSKLRSMFHHQPRPPKEFLETNVRDDVLAKRQSLHNTGSFCEWRQKWDEDFNKHGPYNNHHALPANASRL